MADNNKSYYAIIPADVRYCDNLSANAKLLYGEITTLCNENGFCWAGNKYFSELYNVSEATISRWVKQLGDANFIKIEYSKRGFEITERRIYISPLTKRSMVGLQKDQPSIDEKINRSIDEKRKENNTINNTYNIYILGIIKFWNEQHSLITHNPDVAKKYIKKAHREILSLYLLEEIQQAIKNYGYIIDNDKYFFNYRWTLWEFIPRGLHKFIDKANPKKNFLKDEYKNQRPEETTAERFERLGISAT